MVSPIHAPRLVGSTIEHPGKGEKKRWENIFGHIFPRKSVFNNLNFGNIYTNIPIPFRVTTISFTSMKNSWNICKDNLILTNLSPRFYQPFPRGNKRDSGHQWLETQTDPPSPPSSVSRVTRTIEKWTSRRSFPSRSHDALNSNI